MAQNIDYEDFYTNYTKRLKAKAAAEVRKASKKTYDEYFAYVEKRVAEIFNDVVQRFYDSYSPALYNRSYSLFHLIKTEMDSDGLGISISFDPSEMSPMRSGYNGEDGLYDQVFRKGWHGGADKIAPNKVDKWGVHPQPGTPYWRTPHPSYRIWGHIAEIAKVSPLGDLKSMLEKYGRTEFYDELKRIEQKNINNIKIT